MEYYSNNDSKGVPIVLKLMKYMDFSNGFYIEAGANDGLAQSNTKFFEEQKGWTGLLVEPSTAAFEKLKVNRPRNFLKNVGLVSSDFSEAFIKGDFDGSLMGSVDGKRSNTDKGKLQQVKCCTLGSLLEECQVKKVDLLSLDAEGYEFEILKGANLAKFHPGFILVEIYTKDRIKLFRYLRKNGYVFLECISHYNRKDNPRWDGTHNDYLFKYQPEASRASFISQFLKFYFA